MKKSCIGKNSVIVLLSVVLLFHIYPVSAQDESSDSGIKERLLVVRQVLEKDRPNADRWWAGWLIGYSAATVGQGAISLISKNEKTRQDMALGAATTFLGAMGQIISPLVPTAGTELFAGMPETTPEERMQKMLEAEKLLKELATREKAGRSWKMHAITGAVNIGSGLVVWLGFKRSIWEGVGNFALNTVVTEAQIRTQPTRAVHDYHDYVQRYASGEKSGDAKSGRQWSIYALPGGVGIRIQF